MNDDVVLIHVPLEVVTAGSTQWQSKHSPFTHHTRTHVRCLPLKGRCAEVKQARSMFEVDIAVEYEGYLPRWARLRACMTGSRTVLSDRGCMK